MSNLLGLTFDKLRDMFCIPKVHRATLNSCYKAIRLLLYYVLLCFLHTYRYFISPILPASCKFLPTCSQYMLEAIKYHGPVMGAWLTIGRLCRCHPWQESRYDPVIKEHTTQTSNDNFQQNQ